VFNTKLKRAVILLALSWVLLADLTMSGKISVFPLGIDVELAPGQNHTGSFMIKNTGDTPQDVSVTLNDYARTVDGKNQFPPAGTLDRSLAPFTTVSPATFQLEAGKVQEVQFQLDLPQDQAGPHWMIVMVKESEPTVTTNVGVKGQKGGFAFKANLVFGVRVRQSDPTSALTDGRVTRLQVTPPATERPLGVQLTFKNTGTTFLRPSGRVEIRDRTGQTVANLLIDSFRVLPGAKRTLDVSSTQALEPGKYIALGIIDFGGDFLVAGQAAFQISTP